MYLMMQKDSNSLMSGRKDGMLSISNSSQEEKNSSENNRSLEVYGRTRESKRSLDKVRQMIQGICGRRKSRREKNNCSFIESKPNFPL